MLLKSEIRQSCLLFRTLLKALEGAVRQGKKSQGPQVGKEEMEHPCLQMMYMEESLSLLPENYK